MNLELAFVTVVEAPLFSKKSRKVLNDSEIEELKIFLAKYPQVGDLIPGMHGIRKIRWQANQKGKSGGARVIYFFYNREMPVALLSIYAKADQRDLSSDEKRMLSVVVGEIKREYGV